MQTWTPKRRFHEIKRYTVSTSSQHPCHFKKTVVNCRHSLVPVAHGLTHWPCCPKACSPATFWPDNFKLSTAGYLYIPFAQNAPLSIQFEIKEWNYVNSPLPSIRYNYSITRSKNPLDMFVLTCLKLLAERLRQNCVHQFKIICTYLFAFIHLIFKISITKRNPCHCVCHNRNPWISLLTHLFLLPPKLTTNNFEQPNQLFCFSLKGTVVMRRSLESDRPAVFITVISPHK